MKREIKPTKTENGSIIYTMSGKKHRIGAPAVTHEDGSIFYYKKGLFHRLAGAACISVDGSEQWYINGVPLTKSKHAQELKFSSLKRELKKELAAESRFNLTKVLEAEEEKTELDPKVEIAKQKVEIAKAKAVLANAAVVKAKEALIRAVSHTKTS